jgi:cyclopropane fatty-acyl-phospholipid synthase-like methyltransferase
MDRVLPGRDLELLDIGCGGGDMIHHMLKKTGGVGNALC